MSSELKNNFCTLFQIESLEDVIQLEVHVENEKLSIDLFNFYVYSLELIQTYLLLNTLITNEQSNSFGRIFARLHFVCVDQIELSYTYQGNILRKDSSHAFIDEQTAKFYILKQLEKSEIRYIETMAKYLVQDQRVIQQLISFMMDLSRIYQIQGKHGLIKRCEENIHLQDQAKWILPNVYFIQSTTIEQKSLEEESIDISTEMIEQLMNEPVPERKISSRISVNKDEEKNPTCFPVKASAIESTQSSNTKCQSTDSISSNRSSRKDNENDKSTRTVQVHSAMIDTSNSTSIEITTFKRIRVSRLTGSQLYPLSSSSIVINPNDQVVDESTGRLGEEIVFRFLQWKYPNEQIEWMNERKESGRPYDICIRTKNNQMEFIEVKTTRIDDQHTFQISIAQMEYLLKNPLTYHIYRVYYSDDLQMSKITILSQVKHHLEKKQLAICMTILQRADEQSQ